MRRVRDSLAVAVAVAPVLAIVFAATLGAVFVTAPTGALVALRGWGRERTRRYRVTGRHRRAVARGSQAQRLAVDEALVGPRPPRWAGAHVRAAVVVAC